MIQVPVYSVFLVEDNEIYLHLLKKHLAEHLKMNVQIHAFSSGEECLRNMKLKPKIIILDYFLNTTSPNAMNGLEVLKKIKAASPETEVVMLSSQDNIQVATDTMKYGAFDYVSKNENDLLRVEHAINNIHKMIAQQAELKTNRQVRWVLIAWIFFLLAGILVMQLFFPEMMR
jgi:DNA-binding NarL/FixJ family response regulator